MANNVACYNILGSKLHSTHTIQGTWGAKMVMVIVNCHHTPFLLCPPCTALYRAETRVHFQRSGADLQWQSTCVHFKFQQSHDAHVNAYTSPC